MHKLLISNARLVNEGEIREVDVLVEGARIAKIDAGIAAPEGATVIDAAGKYLLPGLIAVFRDLFPMVRVNVDVTSRRSVMDKLLIGDVALGISSKKSG